MVTKYYVYQVDLSKQGYAEIYFNRNLVQFFVQI